LTVGVAVAVPGRGVGVFVAVGGGGVFVAVGGDNVFVGEGVAVRVAVGVAAVPRRHSRPYWRTAVQMSSQFTRPS
jgi:hypothetical protein